MKYGNLFSKMKPLKITFFLYKDEFDRKQRQKTCKIKVIIHKSAPFVRILQGLLLILTQDFLKQKLSPFYSFLKYKKIAASNTSQVRSLYTKEMICLLNKIWKLETSEQQTTPREQNYISFQIINLSIKKVLSFMISDNYPANTTPVIYISS